MASRDCLLALSKPRLDQKRVLVQGQAIWLDLGPGPHLRAWHFISAAATGEHILQLQVSGIKKDLEGHYDPLRREGRGRRNFTVVNTSGLASHDTQIPPQEAQALGAQAAEVMGRGFLTIPEFPDFLKVISKPSQPWLPSLPLPTGF